MHRHIAALAILASSVFFLAATPATSSAASCHVTLSAGNIGPGHPGGQITFDTCSDVDKIEVDFGSSLNGFASTILYCCSNDFVFSNKYAGINACGSNGYQNVPAGGLAFICHNASGTICGSPTAGCSMWGYRSDYQLTSGCQLSAAATYRLHRWSTNSWLAGQGPSSPYIPC